MANRRPRQHCRFVKRSRLNQRRTMLKECRCERFLLGDHEIYFCGLVIKEVRDRFLFRKGGQMHRENAQAIVIDFNLVRADAA